MKLIVLPCLSNEVVGMALTDILEYSDALKLNARASTLTPLFCWNFNIYKCQKKYLFFFCLSKRKLRVDKHKEKKRKSKHIINLMLTSVRSGIDNLEAFCNGDL